MQISIYLAVKSNLEGSFDSSSFRPNADTNFLLISE